MPTGPRSAAAALAAAVIATIAAPAAAAVEPRCPAGFETADHRGFHGPSPDAPDENTRAAVRVAAQRGETPELDVSATSDGVEFLFHDQTWDRATNGTGRVDRTTWEEARTYRVEPHGSRLIRLRPALLVAKRYPVPVYLDVKGGTERHIANVARIVRGTGMADRVYLTSFTRLTGNVAPGMLRQYKPDGPPPTVAEVADLDPEAVALHIRQMDAAPHLAARLADRGYMVTARLASTEALWSRILRYPVVGLLTERPVAFRRWCNH